MKKFVLGLTLGLILSVYTVSYASNEFKAILFPVTYLFNGSEKLMPSDYQTLNMDGHTYVPTRFIAEQTGSYITFNDANKTIEIQYPTQRIIKSEINSSTEDDIFNLSLHSEKEFYSSNQFLNIWAELRYKGDTTRILEHRENILAFYIEDNNGKRFELGRNLISKTSELKKGDEFKGNMTVSLVQQYYSAAIYNNTNVNPEFIKGNLPPGIYTVGVSAYYFNGSYIDEKSLKTKLQITIKN